METANQERGDPLPPRTLEFRQAMKDFKTMFPTLESDLIECVLRSNAGHVDSTIDQLLQLSQDTTRGFLTNRDRANRTNRFNMYDDSTDSEDSVPSELLDPLTSSDDDDIPVRDPPPMYTPRAGDPAPNFFGPNNPVEVPFDEKKKGGFVEQGFSRNHLAKSHKKTYRAWNPPMLGTLPEDFLRILPQQFTDFSREANKTPASHKKQPMNGQRNTEKRPTSRGNQSAPSRPYSATQANDRTQLFCLENGAETNPGPIPPPRPSRTIDSHNSRRISQKNERERTLNHIDNIERGNLFIQPAAFPNNQHQRTTDLTEISSLSNSQRQRHHHHRSCRNRASTSPAGSLSVSSSGRGSTSSSRTRQRSQFEEEQYVEDCRLAILLQNEEFIHELKRNEEFLKELEKDRHKDTFGAEKIPETIPAEKFSTKDGVVPLPDPDAKYPHGSQNPSALKRTGINDSDKDDERAFKENLRHMGKSARKKFNEIARKFAVRRKTSYKSMRTIDPVFANCDDNFDELPGLQPSATGL